MHCRLAQIVFLFTAWVLLGQESIYAQSTAVDPPPDETSCPSSSIHDEPPSGPEVSVTDVTFSGSLQMPISDQELIADSVKQKAHGTSLDEVSDEGLERVRAGWQDRGYFKVQVTGETRTLTSSPVSQRIALSAHVDEGSRYNLSGITFKNNKAISKVDILRGLFPIADGDIFSREKIGNGLTNLRRAYGELGYINFTSVPDTEFDDENKLISLEIDFDEGMQFRVGSVNVLGLEEPARSELIKALPIKRGQIYSSKLWEKSLRKHASMFPVCDCGDHEQVRLNEKLGIAIVTLNFRPCSINQNQSPSQ